MNLFWLVRLRRWAQHPPSKRMMMLIAGIIAVALGLAAVEHFFGWPEALTVDGRGMRLRAP
ncbi:hypothetical protein [Alkalilacustris brevis]|uniref:hypothetical protein n=1 Tax=Alkalilacustris brevis TaxID=2026338 RepID=UPI000E0DE345|nr:hypothetical protein [Alkalilacustris brevis]